MKQARYELTAAARVDLLEIWNFLAEWETLDVADKVLADLEKGIGRLVEEPSWASTARFNEAEAVVLPGALVFDHLSQAEGAAACGAGAA